MLDWNYKILSGDAEIISIYNNGDHNNLKLKISEVKSDIKLKVWAAGCCFVKGTQVWLADGTTKNIEDIVVGDVVLSYNELTNEYEDKPVIALITNPYTTNIARVKLKDGTSMEMNEYHPIYTEEGWKSLTNYKGLLTLTEKDRVLSVNGQFIEISSIECWKEENPITTYNLRIQDNHNYFVGETPILVHNAGCR